MGAVFYLGAGWPQWKPLDIPGTHLPLKRGSGLTSSNSSDYPNKCQKEGSGDTEKTLETKESNSNKTTKKSSYHQESQAFPP